MLITWRQYFWQYPFNWYWYQYSSRNWRTKMEEAWSNPPSFYPCSCPVSSGMSENKNTVSSEMSKNKNSPYMPCYYSSHYWKIKIDFSGTTLLQKWPPDGWEKIWSVPLILQLDWKSLFRKSWIGNFIKVERKSSWVGLKLVWKCVWKS